jgi:cellulose synthase/poly-beta-1,6-N-acetylglucosamine synthase-like glycosyltransferase
MAYNEANNIARILDALIHQNLDTVVIDSITVVCSGCTDGTEDIVREYIALNPRIKLLLQAKREGKASAVNLFLKNTNCEVLVLESADTIPQPGAIEALVSPFADPAVGMVGGHPVPTNATNTFMGFGSHLLWELHHRVSLIQPKMGELIAFRNIFRQIPYNTAVDEASIEPLIVGQGLRRVYAPDAVVYNRGPETVSDFIKQRRRIFAGHLFVKETLGYRVSTMNGLRIASLYIKMLKLDWRYWVWGPIVIALELLVRSLGIWDYSVRKRNPFCWTMINSTKELTNLSKTATDIVMTNPSNQLNNNG